MNNRPNLGTFSCHLNKKHIICKNPVKLPCEGVNKEPIYSCLDCIQYKLKYAGYFDCLIWNQKYHFDLKSIENVATSYKNELRSKSQLENKANDLFRQNNESVSNLKGN